MSDIFQEVHEEVRQERYLQLWQRYGKYLIAAAFAVVIGTAGFQYWRSYTKGQRERESVTFAAAAALADEGKTALAAEAFRKLGDDTDSGYGILARFRAARAARDGGDTAAAVAEYDALASDSAVPRTLQRLAALYAVMNLMDSADNDELLRRLEPLAEEGGAWQYSALELKGIAALRKGDMDTARDAFTRTTLASTAPPGLRTRAGEMLKAMGPAVVPSPGPEAPVSPPSGAPAEDERS